MNFCSVRNTWSRAEQTSRKMTIESTSFCLSRSFDFDISQSVSSIPSRTSSIFSWLFLISRICQNAMKSSRKKIPLIIMFSIFVYKAWTVLTADLIVLRYCVPRLIRLGYVCPIPNTTVSVKAPLREAHLSVVSIYSTVLVFGDEFVLVREELLEMGRNRSS